MSHITIYPDNKADDVILDTGDAKVICDELSKIGVAFERWDTQEPLPSDADDKAVMKAYTSDIERLKSERGYQSVDVIRLSPDNPKKEELRAKFLSEHTHSEDEVRFFVEGSGVFYLHAADKVYMVLCEAGDLISVPEGAKHWFDMSANPSLTCIRLFTRKDGWIAEYTGDEIADKFPKYEKTEEKAA